MKPEKATAKDGISEQPELSEQDKRSENKAFEARKLPIRFN